MMRRLTTVLISCALLAATGPVVAQETPAGPPWWQGDRAEITEHGFALAIPEGWVAFDLTSDVERQVRTVAIALEMPDDAAQAFTDSLREIGGSGTLLLLSTDDANCEFQVYPAAEPGEFEALAWQRYESALDDEGVPSVDRPRSVMLPSGGAFHLSWVNDTGNPDLSTYFGQQENLAFEIKCSGQSRPQDDWLSVAESFEWLSTATSTDPSTATAEAGSAPADPAPIPAGPPFPDRVDGTGVYDQARAFGPFAVGVAEQVIHEVEEATGAQIVVYTQVKPESDTFEKAEADAAALMDQWGIGPDGLVILLDLDPGLCYGQLQLYADAGYAARHLSIAERQALFVEEMVPPLGECDFDTALLAAMSRISAAAEATSTFEAGATEDPVMEMAALAVKDLFPRELGGGALTARDVAIHQTQQEVREFFDADEPDGAEIEAVRTMAERAGGSIDDITIMDAWFDLEDGTTVVNLGAFQVQGADASDLRDSIHGFAMAFMDDPDFADVEIAGKRVTVYDTMETLERINYLYVHDDIAWLFATFEEYAADVVEALPQKMESMDGTSVATSSAITTGGRIAVPEQGYVLTAPDGWTSIRPTADDAEAIFETLSVIDPDLAATAESALAGDVDFSLLAFGAFDPVAGFRENCNIIDYPSGGDPVGYLLAADAVAVQDMEQLGSGPETAVLDLAAGDVGRLDYGLQYPALETEHAAYYFVDDSMVHLMTCTHVERPSDDWLSIAQTFEFLADTTTTTD